MQLFIIASVLKSLRLDQGSSKIVNMMFIFLIS